MDLDRNYTEQENVLMSLWNPITLAMTILFSLNSITNPMSLNSENARKIMQLAKLNHEI